MSESERRRNYRYNRVLIESARVLAPQFDDAVVFLTGAQIEMLRNVTQYLNRLDTYVDEHNLGYYLTPDAADYDDILEIVADLEETLMGNPNTIWGYSDRLSESVGKQLTADGTYNRILFTVPAGKVYIVNQVSSLNEDSAVETRFRINTGTATHEIRVADPQPADEWLILDGVNYVLKEDDYLLVTMFDAFENDLTYVRCLGSIMTVPE